MTRTVDDAQTQTVRQVCDVGIWLLLHFDHKETQMACYVQHHGTITDNSETDARPLHLEQIKDDDQTVKFYTGFPTFLHVLTSLAHLLLNFVMVQQRKTYQVLVDAIIV